VVPGRRRKLAGVLAEAATGPNGLQHVILGFGINLRPAAYPPEIAGRATSIEAELGRAVDAGLVLAETLAALNEQVGELVAGRSAPVLSRWQTLTPCAIGSIVEWDGPEGTVRGTTAGIDARGALLVRAGAGIQRIHSGEIRWQ
jgi:BirA family transcriptional regulator, biotin operon repressor / biotin---[acetyl-CoA-carboxylase] ligase